MHTRGSNLRGPLDDYHRQVAEMDLRLVVSSPEAFDAVKASLVAGGVQSWREASYERTRSLVHSDEFGIDVANLDEVHTSSVVGILLDTAKILWSRNWCLLVADGGIDFVISDNPSTVVWTKRTPIPGPPGLGHRGTEVALPLTRRLTLVGRHESALPRVPADARAVAELNARTIANAERFVYAASADFRYLGARGGVLDSAAWLTTSSPSSGPSRATPSVRS